MAESPDLDAWRTAAARWTRDAARIQDATSDATDALLEVLAPAAGQTVLDVAAGPGDPSLRIAERVGPSGRVVATDGVEAMIAALRQRADERGLTHVETHVTAAEALDLPAHSVDAACCRFGAMFFADPDEALTRIARIVRPGGRLVLVVWGPPDENPFLDSVARALDDVGAPSLPPELGVRSVFEYAEPGRLAAIAERAGWRDVTDTYRAITMTEHDVTPDGLFERRCDDSDRLAWRADRLEEPQRERARRLVAERVAPHVRGRDVVVPASIRIVSGRAP